MKIKATIVPVTGNPREVILPADYALDEALATRLGMRDGDTLKVEAIVEDEPFDPTRVKTIHGDFDPTKFDPDLLRRVNRR